MIKLVSLMQVVSVMIQVEYYFSDENLKTDTYLMNYVTKDKDGYGKCFK